MMKLEVPLTITMLLPDLVLGLRSQKAFLWRVVSGGNVAKSIRSGRSGGRSEIQRTQSGGRSEIGGVYQGAL